jgi:hypothetical protein
MKKIFTLVSAALLSASLWAQSPQSFSYQAVVRGANNALVAKKQVGMKISLLQGSETGTAVYAETHTPTSNENGLVSIAIGAGSIESGTFTTIDWSKGPYFVKTETDPTGGTSYSLTSTSQLMSVPYALYAANYQPGTPGADGKDGTNGLNGSTGDKGDKGDAGTDGTNGIDGATGAKGDKGDAGTDGTNGASGAKGETGLTGPQGLPSYVIVNAYPYPSSIKTGFSLAVSRTYCTTYSLPATITFSEASVAINNSSGDSYSIAIYRGDLTNGVLVGQTNSNFPQYVYDTKSLTEVPGQSLSFTAGSQVSVCFSQKGITLQASYYDSGVYNVALGMISTSNYCNSGGFPTSISSIAGQPATIRICMDLK